jgi:ribosomal protein S18 acetylase RimI-like enzyme
MASPSDKLKKGHVELRLLELEDLAAVFALGEKLFTAEKWPNLYRTWDEFELIEFFGADEETCFVAELDGKIVGFLLGTLIYKRRSAWSYGWVVWLGVSPRQKRLGIGRRLLDKATDKFIELGARMLLVDTAADNEQALAFFADAGFGNREDHVYLTKNLAKDPRYLETKEPPPRPKRKPRQRRPKR